MRRQTGVITTQEEFDQIPIPVSKDGTNNYLSRKIIVSRDGVQSIPTQIHSLLKGNSKLKTPEEIKNINIQKSKNTSLSSPLGISINTNKEAKRLNDLHELLNMKEYVKIEHLLEHRIADVAYSLKDDDLFVADQVKTACVGINHRLDFGHENKHLSVKHMISILENNMSLTCIGINEDKPDVVWFFTYNAINILKTFDNTQQFRPILHLKLRNNNKFTITMNDPIYRFDIGKSSSEIERLLQYKLEFIKIGIKYSIEFLNEDDSQIPCAAHRIEHESFVMTRDACAKIGVIVKKQVEDNYTCIDFRINNNVKIQDKTFKNRFTMRREQKLPYNPDSFDILQLSNLESQTVYAIPMRYTLDDIIKSTFSKDILMKRSVHYSENFKNTYNKYKFDLKTNEGKQLLIFFK